MIFYDISDTECRNDTSKILEAYGVRVQKSMFVCDIPPESVDNIKKRILAGIDMRSDALLIAPVCSDCCGELVQLGASVWPQETPCRIL